MTIPEPHAHHWIVATPEQGAATMPAGCLCGATRTFPTVRSLTIGFGGTMTDNRARQRRLYDGTAYRHAAGRAYD